MRLLEVLNRRARPPKPPNECRDAHDGLGHVESYFLRANDPKRPRALWLKATIFESLRGVAEAETWGIWFDGEKQRRWAHRVTEPLANARFPSTTSNEIDVASAGFRLGPRGSTAGKLERAGESFEWKLSWTRTAGPVGERLSIFPLALMLEAPFPKSKLLTPFPALELSGAVDVGGEHIQLSRWPGMQGHNWGRSHALEYAWGQCLFPGADGAIEALVEGFTGRISVAGRPSPRLSALVVRRGAQTFRFDRVFDFWTQQAAIEDFRWMVHLTGNDGSARLEMNAAGRPVACLGYRNPDGRMSYCFNSKLAETRLVVEPKSAPSFECRSAHGGALEFLRNEPDARFPEVV
jgi:hypothetical protein